MNGAPRPVKAQPTEVAWRLVRRRFPHLGAGMQIGPILKALGPLIVSATRIVADLRGNEAAARVEERVARLERETLRAGEVLVGVGQQLQSLAEELRRQAEVTAALHARVRGLLVVSLVALALGVAAGVVAWAH